MGRSFPPEVPGVLPNADVDEHECMWGCLTHLVVDFCKGSFLDSRWSSPSHVFLKNNLFMFLLSPQKDPSVNPFYSSLISVEKS